MLNSFINKIKGKKFIEACKKEDIKTIKSYSANLSKADIMFSSSYILIFDSF